MHLESFYMYFFQSILKSIIFFFIVMLLFWATVCLCESLYFVYFFSFFWRLSFSWNVLFGRLFNLNWIHVERSTHDIFCYFLDARVFVSCCCYLCIMYVLRHYWNKYEKNTSQCRERSISRYIIINAKRTKKNIKKFSRALSIEFFNYSHWLTLVMIKTNLFLCKYFIMTHLIVVTFLFYWKTRRLRASKKKTRENLCQHPGSIFIIVTFWSDENFIAQLLR